MTGIDLTDTRAATQPVNPDQEEQSCGRGRMTMADNKARGLYGKFHVHRTDRSPRHPRCDYFVLDLTHDPLVWPAIAAYADAAEAAGYAALAADLRAKVLAAKDQDGE